MDTTCVFLAILRLIVLECAASEISKNDCEVRARTQAGWVCGVRRWSGDYSYASFYNVPYARQPVGELRFKELQAVEPWDHLYDATKPGPICPQTNIIIERLMTFKNMSESCIHANVHVPLRALHSVTAGERTGQISEGLPILVFIIGGGFVLGSGETDFYGPEYLIKRNIIIITFNYRINIFGFLSLNSPSIPGNNGLRDAVTLLKWVQANARNFGGDPDNVTLGGQSSGAASAHLLTLSKAAEGLFKRAILMSGVGIRSFFTPSPKHAKVIANSLITHLGINATDPEEIHRHLTSMPLETIMKATTKIQFKYNFASFVPVIETAYHNITTIIDQDPEISLSNGHGNNISLMIGFTNREEFFYIPSFRENNVLKEIQNTPLTMLPHDLAYKLPKEKALEIARQTETIYFNGTPTVEKYGKYYADSSFVYPALKLAQVRASMKSAPVYLYYFSYNADFSAIKATKNVEYNGAAHSDDLSLIFRTNSMIGTKGFEPPTCEDVKMREQMTFYVKNFMSCNKPICNKSNAWTWQPEESHLPLKYENIVNPRNISYTELTEEHEDTFQYFEGIYNEI